MALIRNGANVLSGLSRFYVQGGTYGLRSVFESSGRRRGRTAGEATVSNVTNRMSMPQGARHPIAWFMPTKAGGLASTNEAEGSSTGALTLADGRNIAATSDGTSTGSATLQLVVSLAGTSDGTSIAAGNVVASLSGAATSEGSSTGSATISAIAWAYGTSSGSCTASLVSYAIGSLSGAITPYTELSPESLASAVIAAAQVSPIYSDVKKVNGYTVQGDGQSGTEWGPA